MTLATNETLDPPPVRCFLSYTHDDDDAFHVVDPLKNSLSSTFEAMTGRTLEIFLDRESIGWGTEWRKDISRSVESAVFFIPLYTARYIRSGPCRDELLAFYSKSKELGVTELILPLILFGAETLAGEPSDEVASIISSRQ